MKKLAVLLALVGVTLLCSPAFADRQEVGAGVGVKVEYFRFMDDAAKNLNVQDGVYLGVDFYKQLFLRNLYFGVEAGWAQTRGGFTTNFGNFFFPRVDLEVNYIPIEFNAKYVIPLNSCLFLDLGAGISYNHINIEAETLGVSGDEDDWLFGGQFFAGLNWMFCSNMFLGVGVKYQLTEDIELVGFNTKTSGDNLRAGLQFGAKF